MVLWTRFSRARRTSEGKPLRDRGAALVEFALIAPLFFFVVFGGIEGGLLFRSFSSLQDVSRTAARIASIERDDPNADVAILAAIQGRVDILNGELLRVVIFDAPTLSTEASDLPIACFQETGGSIDDVCTVYPAADIPAILDGTMDPCNGTTEVDCGFDAADRDAFSNVGIHIEYRYQYVTGFFDSRTLASTSIGVVERSQ